MASTEMGHHCSNITPILQWNSAIGYTRSHIPVICDSNKTKCHYTQYTTYSSCVNIFNKILSIIVV